MNRIPITRYATLIALSSTCVAPLPALCGQPCECYYDEDCGAQSCSQGAVFEPSWLPGTGHPPNVPPDICDAFPVPDPDTTSGEKYMDGMCGSEQAPEPDVADEPAPGESGDRTDCHGGACSNAPFALLAPWATTPTMADYPHTRTQFIRGYSETVDLLLRSFEVAGASGGGPPDASTFAQALAAAESHGLSDGQMAQLYDLVSNIQVLVVGPDVFNGDLPHLTGSYTPPAFLQPGTYKPKEFRDGGFLGWVGEHDEETSRVVSIVREGVLAELSAPGAGLASAFELLRREHPERRFYQRCEFPHPDIHNHHFPFEDDAACVENELYRQLDVLMYHPTAGLDDADTCLAFLGDIQERFDGELSPIPGIEDATARLDQALAKFDSDALWDAMLALASYRKTLTEITGENQGELLRPYTVAGRCISAINVLEPRPLDLVNVGDGDAPLGVEDEQGWLSFDSASDGVLSIVLPHSHHCTDAVFESSYQAIDVSVDSRRCNISGPTKHALMNSVLDSSGIEIDEETAVFYIFEAEESGATVLSDKTVMAWGPELLIREAIDDGSGHRVGKITAVR